jgi:hypothetical protein
MNISFHSAQLWTGRARLLRHIPDTTMTDVRGRLYSCVSTKVRALARNLSQEYMDMEHKQNACASRPMHLVCAWRAHGHDIAETNRMHLVLFGMQNRTFGPYLAANNRILISVMRVPRSRGEIVRRTKRRKSVSARTPCPTKARAPLLRSWPI